MDNNWNFQTLGTGPPKGMNRLPISTPLSRQGSIYSWTLDQIQNNLGKDCGSMNMEELLMNIYSSAEETQGVVPANEGLQRQGSITLPRILSQKTVDEVWKYITEEDGHTNNDGGRTNSTPQIQRQQTLGDTTLEEFLIRAGATGNSSSGGGYIHDPSSSILGNTNTNFNVEFQQKPMVSDLLNSIVPRSRDHGSYLHPNVNGSMSTYQPRQEQQQQQQSQFQPQQAIMSKPHGHGYGYGYGTQLAFASGQVNTHGTRESFIDQSQLENNISLVPSVATIPGGAAMSVDTCSPITPFPLLDGTRKTNVGSSLATPFPYSISGSNSMRNRKSNNGIHVEKKVVEKTQRRKIKNRESAARSRARKQAQTMELEAEVEKLRKENHELQVKQAEMSKIQTKLGKGMINRSSKQLRRTKSDIQ